MAMATGGKGGQTHEINVTPMIDVLLVLLIIFMVVQQEMQRGVSVQVPPIVPAAETSGDDQIVLEVEPGPVYRLNTRPVAAERLTEELRGVFAPRPRKVIFVEGAEGLAYGEVIHAVDASRAAGVEVVGLVPRK